MTAYVPTAVWVAEPPVRIDDTTPGTEPDTVAEWAEPSYPTGELVTERVGVALAIIKLPAEAAVKLL